MSMLPLSTGSKLQSMLRQVLGEQRHQRISRQTEPKLEMDQFMKYVKRIFLFGCFIQIRVH